MQSRRNSSAGLYSIASHSPLQSIRRRSLKYESLGSNSNRSSISNVEGSPQSRDDHKGNSSPENAARDNVESYSPATLDSDVPLHPLRFSSKKLLQTPSESSSVGTPSSILGPPPSPNGPKSTSPKTARLATNSPNTNFLRASLSKFKTFSDRKLKKKMESTVNSASSPVVPSTQTSPPTQGNIDTSVNIRKIF